MAVTVVDDLCRLPSGHTALVVLAGEDPSELQEAEARNMAIEKAAALGLSRPGVTEIRPVMVDEDGERITPEQLVNPNIDERPRIDSYRAEITLTGMI